MRPKVGVVLFSLEQTAASVPHRTSPGKKKKKKLCTHADPLHESKDLHVHAGTVRVWNYCDVSALTGPGV